MLAPCRVLSFEELQSLRSTVPANASVRLSPSQDQSNNALNLSSVSDPTKAAEINKKAQELLNQHNAYQQFQSFYHMQQMQQMMMHQQTQRLMHAGSPYHPYAADYYAQPEAASPYAPLSAAVQPIGSGPGDDDDDDDDPVFTQAEQPSMDYVNLAPVYAPGQAMSTVTYASGPDAEDQRYVQQPAMLMPPRSPQNPAAYPFQ